MMVNCTACGRYIRPSQKHKISGGEYFHMRCIADNPCEICGGVVKLIGPKGGKIQYYRHNPTKKVFHNLCLEGDPNAGKKFERSLRKMPQRTKVKLQELGRDIRKGVGRIDTDVRRGGRRFQADVRHVKETAREDWHGLQRALRSGRYMDAADMQTFRDAAFSHPQRLENPANLTPEEQDSFQGTLNYHIDEGYDHATASSLAWEHIRNLYPRLRNAPQPPQPPRENQALLLEAAKGGLEVGKDMVATARFVGQKAREEMASAKERLRQRGMASRIPTRHDAPNPKTEAQIIEQCRVLMKEAESEVLTDEPNNARSYYNEVAALFTMSLREDERQRYQDITVWLRQFADILFDAGSRIVKGERDSVIRDLQDMHSQMKQVRTNPLEEGGFQTDQDFDEITRRVDNSQKVLGDLFYTRKEDLPVEEGVHYKVLAYTDWSDTFVPTVVQWADGTADSFTNLQNSLQYRAEAIQHVQKHGAMGNPRDRAVIVDDLTKLLDRVEEEVEIGDMTTANQSLGEAWGLWKALTEEEKERFPKVHKHLTYMTDRVAMEDNPSKDAAQAIAKRERKQGKRARVMQVGGGMFGVFIDGKRMLHIKVPKVPKKKAPKKKAKPRKKPVKGKYYCRSCKAYHLVDSEKGRLHASAAWKKARAEGKKPAKKKAPPKPKPKPRKVSPPSVVDEARKTMEKSDLAAIIRQEFEKLAG